MFKQLGIILITTNLAACGLGAVRQSENETERTYKMSIAQVLQNLQSRLPDFLATTSHTGFQSELEDEGTTKTIHITGYIAKNSAFYKCSYSGYGSWGNRLNHAYFKDGTITLDIREVDKNKTEVEVDTSVVNTVTIDFPATTYTYTGGSYSVIPYIQYAPAYTIENDLNNCDSTGIIESSILNLIESEVGTTTAKISANESSADKTDKLKNNMSKGKEIVTFSNGTKYSSEMKNAKPKAQGTMTFSNGTTYTSEIKNGKPEGEATLILPDGTKLVGETKNGKLEGQGTISFPDGTKFSGNFKNGNLEGQSTMVFPNGAKYIGEIKDGKPEGRGMIISPNGVKKAVEFKNGVLVK